MPTYRTGYLCTAITRAPKAWPLAYPIDIEGPIAADIAADPFEDGSRYGLPIPADNAGLTRMIRRNFEPSKDHWRITGTLTGNIVVTGWQPSPGDFDEEEVSFEETVAPFTLDLDSGEVALPVQTRPDFARTTRTLAEVSFSYELVTSGIHPIGFNSATGEIKAGYLVTVFSITARLAPYSWMRQGSYLLEHDCAISIFSQSIHLGPGSTFTQLSPDEGVSIGVSEGVSTRLSPPTSIVETGSLTVTDPIVPGTDTWGILPFWGSQTAQLTTAGLLAPSLTLTCQAHHTPHPGY